MRIEVHEAVAPPGADDITAGLLAHLVEKAGDWPRVPLTVMLKDDAGQLRGGIRGMLTLCWLQIDNFWIETAFRGQGHGSRILAQAEGMARGKGAIGAQLTTSTFQAIGFYEKHGYVEIGRLRDRPPGQDRVWMAKRWG
ncbi:GNAT family N-acetyltransferase [Azospirillum sp. TSO35-2]|uniref:GNAT family N-acetyltransferase n=1 Tax=Azospirillum sp. TSO35-2 TaxID=716796 RepID=UPI0011B765D2|nr:GNAT family N-acetyltransferase [Azospirillum sp. TSO35-2]